MAKGQRTHRIQTSLSLTYKVLTTAQPSYLHNLISVQPPRSTRSSSVVTLSRPPTMSLKITDRSFRYASPRLWNQLPDSFRQPHQSCLDSPQIVRFTIRKDQNVPRQSLYRPTLHFVKLWSSMRKCRNRLSAVIRHDSTYFRYA